MIVIAIPTIYTTISFLGTLSITHKKDRLLPLFPKSTYCLPASVQKPNVDKRNKRIKLVLLQVPMGCSLNTIGIDTYKYV